MYAIVRIYSILNQFVSVILSNCLAGADI